MTKTWHPNQLPISFSEEASTHLAAQLKSSEKTAIRLSLNKGGCSGFMYALDFAQSPEDNDLVYQVDEAFTLYIPKNDLPALHGTQVNFETVGLNSTLTYKNPNADATCGCGESFTVSSKHA